MKMINKIIITLLLVFTGSVAMAEKQKDAEAQEQLVCPHSKLSKLQLYCVEKPEDAVEQEHLAWKYRYGIGADQDDKEAVKWYKKAANQGHVVSQYNLGIMYWTGDGVKKDYNEAIQWFRKLANQGRADAYGHYILGLMYEEGKGVERDYQVAVNWFRKAANQGDADAKKKLQELKDKGYL